MANRHGQLLHQYLMGLTFVNAKTSRWVHTQFGSPLSRIFSPYPTSVVLYLGRGGLIGYR